MTIAIVLPLVVWSIKPDYRQFIETQTISLIGGLSDRQAAAIDVLIDDLDDHQRQRVLVELAERAVSEAQQPMEILKIVLNEVDQRSISDRVTEEILAITFRKTQDRDALLRIFWQEMQLIQSAAPPFEGDDVDQE